MRPFYYQKISSQHSLPLLYCTQLQPVEYHGLELDYYFNSSTLHTWWDASNSISYALPPLPMITHGRDYLVLGAYVTLGVDCAALC